MKFMNPTDYNEDLWDEIPAYASIALGRRGQDKINLQQCFNPKCGNDQGAQLHPLKKEIIPKEHDKLDRHQTQFLIYCEKCQTTFALVFDRVYKEDEAALDKQPIFDRISAINPQTQENYGEIGYVTYG